MFKFNRIRNVPKKEDTKKIILLSKMFEIFIKMPPPKVSSVHINGERAYKRSFRNETFDLPEREVTVSELTLKNGIIIMDKSYYKSNVLPVHILEQ